MKKTYVLARIILLLVDALPGRAMSNDGGLRLTSAQPSGASAMKVLRDGAKAFVTITEDFAPLRGEYHGSHGRMHL